MMIYIQYSQVFSSKQHHHNHNRHHLYSFNEISFAFNFVGGLYYNNNVDDGTYNQQQQQRPLLLPLPLPMPANALQTISTKPKL